MGLWDKAKVIRIYGDRAVLEDEDTDESWEVTNRVDIARIRTWFQDGTQKGKPLA